MGTAPIKVVHHVHHQLRLEEWSLESLGDRAESGCRADGSFVSQAPPVIGDSIVSGRGCIARGALWTSVSVSVSVSTGAARVPCGVAQSV